MELEGALPRDRDCLQSEGVVVATQTILWDGLAALGYDAYGRSTGWKNFLGDPMPKWEELPRPIQEAWMAAAVAIADAYGRAALA